MLALECADDQGYAFKVITELHGIDEMENLVFKTQGQQISLLEEVLNTGHNDWETSDHYMRLNNGKHQHKPARAQPDHLTSANSSAGASGSGGVGPVQRFMAPLEHLSGGQNLSYQERNKNLKYVTLVSFHHLTILPPSHYPTIVFRHLLGAGPSHWEDMPTAE